MASKKFHARHGLSVGVGTSPIDVIDSAGNLLIIPQISASNITSGTIDAARLPSYVDDVLEATDLASLPATGEAGKIYVTIDTNKTYRWSGSIYVEISPAPDLSGYLTTSAAASTYISTTPGTTGNVLTSNGTAWVSQAASGGGGGGGSVDLTAVAQSIKPSITNTYDLGSDTKRWKNVNVGSSIDINTKTSTTTNTVTDVTTVTAAPSTVTYHSVNTLNGSTETIDGQDWNGIQYFGAYPDTDTISSNFTGSGYFYRYANAPSNIPTSWIGKTITISGDNASFSIIIDTISDNGFMVNWTWHAADTASAQTLVDIFWNGITPWGTWYNTTVSTSVQSINTIITTDSPVSALPANSLITVNGSTTFLQSIRTVNATNIPLSVFDQIELGSIDIGPTSITFNSTAYDNVLPTSITGLKIGDTFQIRYSSPFDSPTTVRTATYTITQTPAPTDWGYGIWKIFLDNLTLVSESTPYLASVGSFQCFDAALLVTKLWDISALTLSPPNSYTVPGTYTGYPVGTIFGYITAPKVTIASDIAGGTGFEIMYDLLTKKPVYGGLAGSMIGYFTNANTVNRAIQSDGVLAPDTGASRNRSIIIGDGAYATDFSVSIGENAGYSGNANNTSNYSVSIGYNSKANASECTALGYQATAQSSGTTALGAGAVATYYGTAVGGYSSTAGFNGVALGSAASGSNDAVGIGTYAHANGSKSISIGKGSTATGEGTIVVGYQASSVIPYSTTIDTTGNIDVQNGTIKFQYWSNTPITTGTTYLSPSGTADTSASNGLAAHPVYSIFGWQGTAAGMATGTATFMMRAYGQAISAPVWKVVEIKFVLYMHVYDNDTMNTSTGGDYELRIISTNTIATSVAAGHAAWTPSIALDDQVGMMFWDPSFPVLVAKITNSDSVSIAANAKFELNTLNYTS